MDDYRGMVGLAEGREDIRQATLLERDDATALKAVYLTALVT